MEVLLCSGMGDHAQASAATGGLGDATPPTHKHGRPSDLHMECWGCELGLSINDDSHMCYTVAGPAFNQTWTSVDTDILTQVQVTILLPCFSLLTPLLPH